MRRGKQKGRFVVEASVLLPGMCLLLVYLCFFLLYAHDYAVCAQAALESGVKGIYRQGLGDSEIEKEIKEDLEQKLGERLLWMKDPQIEITVNPVRAEIVLSGTGSFWPTEEIEIRQSVYRIRASETVRATRTVGD